MQFKNLTLSQKKNKKIRKDTKSKKNSSRDTRRVVATRTWLSAWLWLFSVCLVCPTASSCAHRDWTDFSDHESHVLVPGQFLGPLINDTQCAVIHGRSRDVLLGTAAADVQTELHAAAFTMRLRISWYAACWLLAALGDMFWLGAHCFVKSQTKSSKKKNPGGKRLKFRKVPSTSWNRIKMWKGPWRQAFRQLEDLHFFCPPARHVGNMRVPGVKVLKGLGRCWRRSPAKTCVVADAKLVSCCRSYLLKRQQRNQMLHSQATIGNKDLDNGRISYQTPADIFHLADELAGGMAGGAHVTKRKRRKAAHNDSLADALQCFLSQWQQAQKPPKKKGGTNAVSKDSGVISRSTTKVTQIPMVRC